jgi:dihydroorotate dehydrogenase (NAD+) catalytic subunit
MTDLTVTLGDLTLPSPLMTAAGCGGAGPELARFTDLAALGAFVTRTTTRDPRPGAAPPRIVETPGGVLWAGGGQNPGLQAMLTSELPWLAQHGVRVVASIAATSLGEYAELARRLGESAGVVAVEVDLGEVEPYPAGKALTVVRRDLPRGVTLLAKTGAEGAVDLARAAVDAGADAVVVGHGPAGLACVTGRLGGPAVRAAALHRVRQVHDALPGVPLVGVGGIATAADVRAMLAAGAGAVQLGTVLLHDPGAPDRIRAELGETR